MSDYTKPDPWLDRVPHQNHYGDWLDSCKAGKQACSNFSYSGPFTEMVNFGNLVVKSGKKLHWDNKKQHADQFDDTFPYLKTPLPGSPSD